MNRQSNLRPISEIAQDISKAWDKIYFGAVPYLNTLFYLNSINDKYGCDNADTIILYFLSNAAKFRGPAAKTLKAELREHLKKYG